MPKSQYISPEKAFEKGSDESILGVAEKAIYEIAEKEEVKGILP